MKAFQSPPPHITRADVPLPALEQQIRDIAERQAKAVAEVPDDRHLRQLTHPVKTTPEEAS